MLSFLRRLVGADRLDEAIHHAEEQRDRDDALRSADRARSLARRLRRDEELRREFALRAAVIRRSRRP